MPQPTLQTFAVFALVGSLLMAWYAVSGIGPRLNLGMLDIAVPDLTKPRERICWAFAAVAAFALFLALYSKIDLNDYLGQLKLDLPPGDLQPQGAIDINLARAGTNSAKRCALANYVFDQYSPDLYPDSLAVAAHADQKELLRTGWLKAATDYLTRRQYCFVMLRQRLVKDELDLIQRKVALSTTEADRVALRDAAPLGATSNLLATFPPRPPSGYIYLGRVNHNGDFVTWTYSPHTNRMPQPDDHLSTMQFLNVVSEIPDPAATYPSLAGVYQPNTHVHMLDKPTIVKNAYVYAFVEPEKRQ